MTERQFLDRQSRRIRDRIRRGSIALHDEIERAVGPTVRKHPRLSLAAGASAGLLVGRILATPFGSPSAQASRGTISGGLKFIKETGLFALRSMIVGSLLSSVEKSGVGRDQTTEPRK